MNVMQSGSSYDIVPASKPAKSPNLLRAAAEWPLKLVVTVAVIASVFTAILEAKKYYFIFIII